MNKLVALRKKQGISQETVADCLGYSLHTIQRWERTLHFPDPGLLGEYLNLLGASIIEKNSIILQAYGCDDFTIDDLVYEVNKQYKNYDKCLVGDIHTLTQRADKAEKVLKQISDKLDKIAEDGN